MRGYKLAVDFQKRVNELEQFVAEQAIVITQLRDEIARLKKNSSNSSKPPSSDIVSGKPKSQYKDRKEKKKKRGGQKGRKACVRQPFEQDKVDEWVTHSLDLDPTVWELLPDDFGVFQQVDLVDCPTVITEHRFARYRNRETGEIYTTPRPAELKGQGLFGPRLVALTSCLKSGLHGSYREIQKLFRDALGLSVSVGYLVKVTDQMTRALELPYETLKELIRAQPVVNIDETGHKENGKRPMTWVATCPIATLFRIADTRSAAELYELLGEDFDGVVCSDFFSAYLKFARDNPALRAQYCWAHLIRELLFLEGLTDKSTRTWAGKVLVEVKKLFRAWRRDQIAACRRAQAKIEKLCQRRPKRADIERLGGRIWDYRRDYFRFLEDPSRGIEPTNNPSEQKIRPVVMHRKVTQGTRSEKGRRWWERVWSMVQTCRQHGRSVFEYFIEVLAAEAAGLDPPSPVPV